MQPSGLERGTALGHDEVAVFENIVGLNPGRAKPLKIITRAFTCSSFLCNNFNFGVPDV